MFRVRPNLSLIQPFQRLNHTLLKLILFRQPRLNQRLCNEPRIPELTPVRPTHHHPLRTHPHEVLAFVHMLLVCEALSAFGVITRYEIEHFGDRSEGLIPCVLILHDDKAVRTREPFASERREDTVFVTGENGGDCIE